MYQFAKYLYFVLPVLVTRESQPAADQRTSTMLSCTIHKATLSIWLGLRNGVLPGLQLDSISWWWSGTSWAT